MQPVKLLEIIETTQNYGEAIQFQQSDSKKCRSVGGLLLSEEVFGC